MRSAVLIGGIPAVASSGALCGLAPGLLSLFSLLLVLSLGERDPQHPPRLYALIYPSLNCRPQHPIILRCTQLRTSHTTYRKHRNISLLLELASLPYNPVNSSGL